VRVALCKCSWPHTPDVLQLSVVIVTFNSAADISGCIESLQTTAIPHEIIVVDNASSDGTADLIRVQWPAVRVVDAGGNIGFARANNLGIRLASGPLVLLINPDTVVNGPAIDGLAACLGQHLGIAAVGPRIVDGQGRAELSWGAMMSPLAEVRQKLLVVGHDRGWRLASAAVEQRTAQSRDVDWVSGACLMARREDLQAIGLFDERFFLYTEDVDLCARLRAHGKRVHFLASVSIVHHRGRSGASVPAATRAAYRRSHLAFYEKHHPGWAPLLRIYLKVRGALPDTR
jgi:N-acetylglucosaminyl-diphospho-decaprenol L-rhamnosyltransferase